MMGYPVLAQQVQGALWQRHIPVFCSLTVTYMQEHSGAIDLVDLQMNALLQAQTASVNRAQADPVVWLAQATKNLEYLVNAEDYRQLLLPGWPHQDQRRPFPL